MSPCKEPWAPPVNSIEQDVATISRIDVIPKILEVVCRATGMGFAAVARVTEDRWVACAVRDEIEFGLTPGGELIVSTTICDQIRDSRLPVVIDHVAEDPGFREHPTPKLYGFQSYISVPIITGGEFFGTLCAIDPRPNILSTPQTLGMVELFADLIARHLEAEARWADSEAALLSAHEGAELRDQFIAVLGHDLRNPLASIDGGARLLLKTPLNDRAGALVGMMQNSVRRMAGLIDDVLDFARGRLGGGFDVERRPDTALGQALEQVVAELRVAHPERVIDADLDPDLTVESDSRRVAQLASNLLSNALTHGAPGEPIRLSARKADGEFALSVSNQGEPIPAEAMDRLFQPFSRASVRPNQQGLGLGLYIASEIARAHGGSIRVLSDPAETRFTFTMPLAAPAAD
jgi:signal transduction histidine kinase